MVPRNDKQALARANSMMQLERQLFGAWCGFVCQPGMCVCVGGWVGGWVGGCWWVWVGVGVGVCVGIGLAAWQLWPHVCVCVCVCYIDTEHILSLPGADKSI